MKVFVKYKTEILIFLILSIFYFAFRLYNLLALPIFTDEAIYLRWSQIALHDSSWRFISLTDGKQPLFIWFIMIFMKFIKDPLLAGRLVSVCAGFFTMLGLFFLSLNIFQSKKIAFITSGLYIFYPFAQVYDRMALMEGMVGTFSVWIFYFSILLIKKLRFDVSYSLGFLMGAGILTKSENFLNIYLLPLTLILFPFKTKRPLTYLLKWIALALFAIIISQVFYGVLRLSPLYGVIAEKNATFVYPLHEWFHHPFRFLIGNLRGMFGWLFDYLTPVYLLLVIGSLSVITHKLKEKLLLFLYFVLPFFALALFGRTLFPRFIYFMSLFLLPLAAWFLYFLIDNFNKRIPFAGQLKSPYAMAIIMLILVAYPGFISLEFAQNPRNASITKADSDQYVNNWTAGWGVKQSIDYFQKQADNHKIFIATEGTFGLLPESMELHLVDNPNVTIKGFWPIQNSMPQEVISTSKEMDTYFIFYQPCPSCAYPGAIPIQWRQKMQLLYRVKSSQNKDSYFTVYKVKP